MLCCCSFALACLLAFTLPSLALALYLSLFKPAAAKGVTGGFIAAGTRARRQNWDENACWSSLRAVG